MSTYNFDAVIFDLDGVITQTASVHSSAWKKMFNDFLKDYEVSHNLPFKEFTHQNDYLPFVDGKPRYNGVKSFLESRGIDLPFGDPSDKPAMETVCGLGNRKDIAFNDILRTEGVKTFPSTVAFIHDLIAHNVRIGVASSSKNCKNVLTAAGLIDLFETRVDGVVSAEIGLNGKPEPDIFTTAADNIGVAYEKTIVVEDAVSGVQAGRKGGFGLTLGIAREENVKELKINGADIVVTDMDEISIEEINDWFATGLEKAQWNIEYNDYDPIKEKTREALLTVGNGYFGTRGAFEEICAGENNYPGTYIAGTYNRLATKIGEKDIYNEDFVNVPNWLPINFKIEDGHWLDINNTKILSFKRNLDLKTGVLKREITIQDNKGQKTKIVSKRIASMANPHLASLKYSITPLNYSAKVAVKSGLDGAIINDGVARYRQLNQQHLKPVSQNAEGAFSELTVSTTESGTLITENSRLSVFNNNTEITPEISHEIKDGSVFSHLFIDAKADNTYTIEKTVSIFTSRDKNISNPVSAAKLEIEKAGSFEEIKKASAIEWSKIWEETDIKIEGDRNSQQLLRLHNYHMLVSASKHNQHIDASVTARGLHGEAYRGHIFWDELFILPYYNLHYPEASRSFLMYRYNRLNEARKYAKEYGFKGAMFPWQSGSDGREETQVVHLNPLTGTWGDDYSSLQRHVSLAIGYNVWEYYHTTNDIDFLSSYGAEIFLEICRFWASKSELDKKTGKYHIAKVMGPDEFHEKYPEKKEGGIQDNTYTNIMSVWSFQKAFDILDLIGENRDRVLSKINLNEEELNNWKKISNNMNIVIKDDILAQYDGYFDLKELDWDAYNKKYDNIYRMDRILKSEGKSADDYKVAKQADTLMTFYNLDVSEVTTTLNNLGYNLCDDYLTKNLEYYLKRTSHGSTLSRIVHSQLASMAGDTKLSWELYQDALGSDFNDIQGGTTGEGIHFGVMSGTIMIALTTYAGLNIKNDNIHLNPKLPKQWKEISFGITFKGTRYLFKIDNNVINITCNNSDNNSVTIFAEGEKYSLNNNTIEINRLKK
ncbi:MAG: HAD-IA family hydrolase [Bacteroidota bacterium]|nr:HAD-IA family hydrolase [Bacteroidota bacterium]